MCGQSDHAVLGRLPAEVWRALTHAPAKKRVCSPSHLATNHGFHYVFTCTPQFAGDSSFLTASCGPHVMVLALVQCFIESIHVREVMQVPHFRSDTGRLHRRPLHRHKPCLITQSRRRALRLINITFFFSFLTPSFFRLFSSQTEPWEDLLLLLHSRP